MRGLPTYRHRPIAASFPQRPRLRHIVLDPRCNLGLDGRSSGYCRVTFDPTGPVREHELASGHLVDVATDYAIGRMAPADGFVEGDESAAPQPELVGAG